MNPYTKISYDLIVTAKTLLGYDGMYIGEDGGYFEREFGKTPNGNDIAGRWVLRDAQHKFIDVDAYRNDMAERHNISLRGLGRRI